MKMLAPVLFGLLGMMFLAGCGNSSSTEVAPSGNEYEAYLAEHPEEAAVMSEDQDSGLVN